MSLSVASRFGASTELAGVMKGFPGQVFLKTCPAVLPKEASQLPECEHPYSHYPRSFFPHGVGPAHTPVTRCPNLPTLAVSSVSYI